MPFLFGYSFLMMVYIFLYARLNSGFWLFLFLSVCSLFIYYRVLKKDGRLPVSFPPSNFYAGSRIAAYDRIRLLAVCLVLLTHTVQTEASQLDSFSLPGRLCSALWVPAMVCNTLYVLLSGALLYTDQDTGETLFAFYAKKLSRIFIPLTVYFIWYLWANLQLPGERDALSLQVMWKDFWSGIPPQAPHFWLIWRIMFLYLTAPLINRILRRISWKVLTIILSAGLICCGAAIWLPPAGYSFPFRSTMAEWLLVALAGWWLVRPQTRKLCPFPAGAGIVCGIFIAAAAFYYPDFSFLSDCLCNTSPVMTLFGAAIFVLLFLRKEDPAHPPSRLLPLLARYNYGMILIHWWALHFITRGLLHITGEVLPLAPLFLVNVCLSLPVSLAAAFGIDHFLVFPLQHWFMKLIISRNQTQSASRNT